MNEKDKIQKIIECQKKMLNFAHDIMHNCDHVTKKIMSIAHHGFIHDIAHINNEISISQMNIIVIANDINRCVDEMMDELN